MESVDSASETKVEQEYRLANTCRVQAPQQEPGAGDVIWMRWPWNAENGHDDRITTYRTGKKAHTYNPRCGWRPISEPTQFGVEREKKRTEKPDAGFVAN